MLWRFFLDNIPHFFHIILQQLILNADCSRHLGYIHMLTIRSEQMRNFFFHQAGPFRVKAIQYLQETFPEKCQQMEKDAIRASIDLALEKAWIYDFKEDDQILIYLKLMYTLGFDFDENADYPWVQAILKDRELQQRTKLDLLHKHLHLHLHESKQ